MYNGCKCKHPTDIVCFGYIIANSVHKSERRLNPWSRVLIEKLTGSQLIKEFPISCNPKVLYRSKTAFHLSLSSARSIQSMPPTSLFLQIHHKTLYTPLLSLIRATCCTHLILLKLITRTVVSEYSSLSSSLCSFLPSSVTPSLLGPKFLNTRFSNTLNLRSSLNVSDQVSHPYKTD